MKHEVLITSVPPDLKPMETVIITWKPDGFPPGTTTPPRILRAKYLYVANPRPYIVELQDIKVLSMTVGDRNVTEPYAQYQARIGSMYIIPPDIPPPSVTAPFCFVPIYTLGYVVAGNALVRLPKEAVSRGVA